jgi:hypothetical protein
MAAVDGFSANSACLQWCAAARPALPGDASVRKGTCARGRAISGGKPLRRSPPPGPVRARTRHGKNAPWKMRGETGLWGRARDMTMKQPVPRACGVAARHLHRAGYPCRWNDERSDAAVAGRVTKP